MYAPSVMLMWIQQSMPFAAMLTNTHQGAASKGYINGLHQKGLHQRAASKGCIEGLHQRAASKGYIKGLHRRAASKSCIKGLHRSVALKGCTEAVHQRGEMWLTADRAWLQGPIVYQGSGASVAASNALVSAALTQRKACLLAIMQLTALHR